MPDAPTQPRLWIIYVQDMIQYAETALTYTRGMGREAFLSDDRTYHATLWNIERIGGAAAQVPAPVREAFPHVRWGKFMETQDRNVYPLSRSNDNGIWEIIQTDLPTLAPHLRKLLAKAEELQRLIPPRGPSGGKASIGRQQVLNALRKHKPILEERFGVTELTLFGSFARDQATEESDVDIIVKFNGPATSKGYFGTLFYIEDLLGRTVDLATDKSLRSEILPFVERDTINV